jgi:hypothetical protein
MSYDNTSALKDFRDGLIGLPVSHLWRGYGSAIFLEFGRLTPRIRPSGEAGNPHGEFGLMIQWSWRIENMTSILCGSWSEETLWEPTFDLLRNKTAVDASVVGRLPEISVALTEGFYVSSFMTAEGDPSWTLFDRRDGNVRWLTVRDGSLKIEFDSPSAHPAEPDKQRRT